MHQGSTLPTGGTIGEALSREVLTVEIREARDLLPADRMMSCEPYVVISVFDSSGRPIGTRRTNVVAGSLNPYWMERFEFQVTQWDKEGGYVEIAAYDNRDNERLGYIRQPLFRISEAGAMEGWHFMDRSRHQSAAIFFRMLVHPYRSLAGGAPALASGVSARQAPAATGIGLSGVGSRTPVGPTEYSGTSTDGFASPSGMPMGAAPATATPTIGAPGLTPAVGPAMARAPGTAPLFIMRQHFWGLANTYEVKDAQGLLLYRLIGSFGERLDDIRIADSSGHEVGFIREESSLLSKVYRMPTYLISVYGTTAKLKKKFLSINEPIYSLRPFNAQSIHAKGNFSHTEFSFYQLDTIIADVSKGLATGGDGLYGIRVAPTFSNPLLILAATVAIDRINDVSGLRPMTGVYNESKTTLMSRVKRRGKKPTVVTTTAVPLAATTTTATPVAGATRVTTTATPVVTPVAATGATTTARTTETPLATATAPIVTPVTTPMAAGTTYAQPTGTTTSGPYAQYYDARGIPTTPVVSVTTMSGADREGWTDGYGGATTMAAGGETTEMMQPRAEMAARETLRQEEQRMMQAERLDIGQSSSGMTPPIIGYEGQPAMAQQHQQHEEKERDQRVTESELRRGQPTQIPIMGDGAFA